MLRRIWSRNSVSYKESGQRLRATLDPLGFLNADATGTSKDDALDLLHSTMHACLEDVEKAFLLIFEQLNPEANVSDRIILDANSQIRNEQARARSLVDLKQDELIRQIRIKLENLFIQGLVQSTHDEPSVRRWENLSARMVERNEPSVSE